MFRTLVLILAIALPAAPAAAGDERAPRSTATIAALLEQAEPGATVRVPAGRYEGTLRITRPVVLDGGGEAVIAGPGKGTVVEIHSAGVTFRGFTVESSGAEIIGEPAGIRAETGPVVVEDNVLRDVLYGIDLRTSPDSIVRRNRVTGKPLEPGRRGDGIRLWWSVRCLVEDNVVNQTRDAVFWYSEDLTIRRNIVEDGRYGLHFMYSHETILEDNTLQDNSVGVYLMYSNNITLRGNTLARNRGPSGYGLGLKDCDGVVVQRNHLLANRVGIYADNAPSSIGGVGRLEENLIAFNEIGIAFTPNTRGNVITGNGFVENEEQGAVLGRGDMTGNEFAEAGRGNFWSDYAGFDRDGDGVGDLPYKAVSLFESLLASEPNLRLFVHSPAQQAIEFTARALPEVRPEPKFTDPAPLMSPPTLAHAHAPSIDRRPMAALGSALLALGLGAVAAGRWSLLALPAARRNASHTQPQGEGESA